MFEAVFDRTLGKEGGFSDDQTDRGGATKYGITERIARANGYTGEMRDLSEPEASRIAKAQYWDLLRLDEVAVVSAPTAEELFDTGYNCGPGTAGKFLQRCLNALNLEGKDYPDLTADGLVGPMTIAALRSYLQKRGNDGERVLLRALNALQGARYIEIAEKDSSQKRFMFGWLLNRVS